jgi:hypothetical protein
MSTKAQDIVIGLKISLSGARETYATLAAGLGMSASEVHAAVRRLQEARLVDQDSRKVRLQAFRSFLLFGVPYAFPAHLGEPCRGIPTAWAFASLSRSEPELQPSQLLSPMPPVWLYSKGTVLGLSVRPLYPSVPHAAGADPRLHDWLSLVDTLRLGVPGPRALAQAEIERRLAAYGS